MPKIPDDKEMRKIKKWFKELPEMKNCRIAFIHHGYCGYVARCTRPWQDPYFEPVEKIVRRYREVKEGGSV